MCNWCDTQFYIKVEQFTAPVLAPLTRADELRQELINITGKVYTPINVIYCPMCGREVKRYEKADRKNKA